ncbi:MAG TPA: hypothetical protein VFU42_06470 [Candidatus Deferrimicrobiaceae bacterium]|nr:hypothetical protein [Candidatus Deferrimicrobiaceae bacterium]
MRSYRNDFPKGLFALAPASLAFLVFLGVFAAAEGVGEGGKQACTPTRSDSEGPFYEPGAPSRTSTGRGLVVRGRLLGAPDCRPLPDGRIEWWQTDRRGRYDDDHRGSQATGPDGAYRFSTDFPGIYPGRPPHIHFKAAAPGYRLLTTQLYLRGGEAEVEFDIVLVPDR